MPTKDSRCWPGYEPVKGKKEHEQGSCRPKAESKLDKGEKDFRAKRERQLTAWKKQHPGSGRSAAQHLQSPSAKKKAGVKRAPAANKRSHA